MLKDLTPEILAAIKDGKTIEFKYIGNAYGNWLPYTSRTPTAIIADIVTDESGYEYRIAEEKITKKYRVYLSRYGLEGIRSVSNLNTESPFEDIEDKIEKSDSFVRWLSKAVEVDV
jgi:hypothetical protein